MTTSQKEELARLTKLKDSLDIFSGEYTEVSKQLNDFTERHKVKIDFTDADPEKSVFMNGEYVKADFNTPSPDFSGRFEPTEEEILEDKKYTVDYGLTFKEIMQNFGKSEKELYALGKEKAKLLAEKNGAKDEEQAAKLKKKQEYDNLSSEDKEKYRDKEKYELIKKYAKKHNISIREAKKVSLTDIRKDLKNE